MNRNYTIDKRLSVLALSPEWLDVLAELAIQPRFVSELMGLLNLPQSTVSQRLVKMQAQGLVSYTVVPTGHAGRGNHLPLKSHLYRLEPDAIIATAADIRNIAAQIEETAARIESYIKKKKL